MTEPTPRTRAVEAGRAALNAAQNPDIVITGQVRTIHRPNPAEAKSVAVVLTAAVPLVLDDLAATLSAGRAGLIAMAGRESGDLAHAALIRAEGLELALDTIREMRAEWGQG